jgi:hypothetical protein
MWSDTLLALERAHLLRFLLWGAMSVVAGTGLLAWVTMSGYGSSLLRGFSKQTAAWGLVVLTIAGMRLLRIADRDLGEATALDRMLWLSVGLDIGLIVTGATLAVAAWTIGRRLGAVGAGVAIAVQATGLLVLDLHFAAITARIF